MIRLSFIITALLLVFVLPPTALAKDRTGLLEIQELTTDSGIDVWLVEDHTLPIITIKFAFKGSGSSLETAENQGLARLLSNTMDEGAGEYDSQSFQKALTDHSISLNFANSRDSFIGGFTTLTKYSDLAFDLVRLALTEPHFDEEPLNRMRDSNIARIKSSLADPNWIAARISNDVIFGDHPYALNSGGTLTTLQSLTADDLRAFLKENLVKDRLYISVVGDITKERLVEVIDHIFGKLPQSSTNNKEVGDVVLDDGGKIFLHEKDIPQTIVDITQKGIARDDPDYQYAQIMNYILGGGGFGSRLTEEIREKRGLTYGIYTSLTDMDHAHMISLSTSTKNESVKEMLELIDAEWNSMLEKGITEEELKAATSYLIGSVPLSLSSTGDIVNLMLGLQLDGLPINYLDIREQKMREATVDDINRVTKRLLAPSGLTTILVGKPEGITPTETIDTIPNVE